MPYASASSLRRSIVALLVLSLTLAVLPAAAAQESHTDDGTQDRRELVERRTETTKTYLNPDGSMTTALFSGPIHYLGDGGAWRDLETTLIPTETGAYSWRSGANRFTAFFKQALDEDHLRFRVDGQSFGMTIQGTQRSGASAHSSRISYNEVFPGVDLRYDVVPDGVKETLVLADANTPTHFRFVLTSPDGVPVDIDERSDGSWVFTTAPHAEPVLVLAAPFAFDSTGLEPEPEPTQAPPSPEPLDQSPTPLDQGDQSSPSPETSPADAPSDGSSLEPSPTTSPEGAAGIEAVEEASEPEPHSQAEPKPRGGEPGDDRESRTLDPDTHASMDVREIGKGRFAIDLMLDPKWLRDPARQFPVFLDPTLTVQPTSQDTHFDPTCAACPAGLDTRLRIGTEESTDRAAVKFDMASIPADANIISAQLGLLYDGWQLGATGSPASGTWQIDAHRLTNPWTEISLSRDFTFDPSVLSSYTLAKSASWPLWLTWDVTGVTRSWVSGAQPNYGVMLKRNVEPRQEGGPTVVSRRLTNANKWPKLTVTYVSEAVQLLEPTTLHSNGAELSWTPYQPQEGSSFQKYEVHRSATDTFTPSPSTLVATIQDQSLTSYRDTAAAPSKTFTYKVVTNSSPSNTRTVALPAAGYATKLIQPDPATGNQSSIAKWPNKPCVNYGAEDKLWVGTTDVSTWRSLLNFDLRDIPSTASISSAELSLWHQDTVGTAATVNAHRVTRSWSEGAGRATCDGTGASWFDAQGGVRWATEGGDFDSTPAASVSAPLGEQAVWHRFDLTALTRQWVKGEVPNFGVALKAVDESAQIGSDSKRITYYSDDLAVSPNLRPKLAVSYEDGSQAQAPTTSVSSPAPNASVSGTSVQLAATAADDGRVDKVEFMVDGAVIASDNSAPFEASWNSTTVSNGSRAITARAIDDAGNASTSSPVSVTVENSSPPTVTVTAPTAGASVKGTVNVSATANDDIGVTGVEFFVDGVRIGQRDDVAPFTVAWNTLDSTQPSYDGSHQVTARAFDGHGQSTTSAGINVTVANTSATKFMATLAAATAVPQTVTYDPAKTIQDKHPVDVTVTNKSATTFRSAEVFLRYRWLKSDGTVVSESGDVSLGADLAKSKATTRRIEVLPPTLEEGVAKAQYTLRFDLFDKPTNAYFAAKGNAPLDNPVIVNKALKATALGLERYYHYEGDNLGAGMTALTNVANGNALLRWTPFSSPGRGLSTVVDLTYNSLEDRSDSPVGNNFSLSVSSLTRFGLPLDIHPNKADELAGRATTAKYIEFTDGDGTTHRFTANAAGGWDEPPGVHLYLRQYSTTDLSRKWALTRPDQVTFFYNDQGFPTSAEDANGNRIQYTLEDVPAAEDPGGVKRRITSVTDASGLGTNPAQNRSFAIDYYSKDEASKPQVRGKIQKITDHNGSALLFDYYDDGNLLRLTQKGGTKADGSFLADRSFVFTYTTSDGSGPAIPLATGRERPEAKTANQSARIFSVRDPRGSETTFSYFGPTSGQDRWKLKTRTDREGHTTSLGYAPSATPPVTTVTAPLQRVSKFAYDTDGKVTAITNPKGENTSLVWSADRHVTKVTEATGAFTEYRYNDNGYLTDVWDQLRNHTKLEYDNLAVDTNDTLAKWKLGRTIGHVSLLVKKINAKGTATAAEGDFTWTFGYDNLKRNVTSVKDPEGAVSQYTYNGDGTLASATDANLHRTEFASYDANGLPTRMLDAKGRVTTMFYTEDGLLRWVQDPLHADESSSNDREYRHYFDYDSFHRLGRQSTPKSTRLQRGRLIWTGVDYDLNDNVLTELAASETPGGGVATTTTYDRMDRPELTTGPDRSVDSQGERVRFAFDAAGRTTSVTLPRGVQSSAIDKDSETTLTYDSLDRVVKQTRYNVNEAGAVTDTLNTHFCYDLAGDLRSVTMPKAGLGSVDCSATSLPFTTRMTYDAAHSLRSQADPLGNATSVVLDANGAVTTTTDEEGNVSEIVYDAVGRVVKTIEPLETGRTVTTKLVYDPVGNLIKRISPRAWDASADKQTFTDYVTSYSYNELDQMVRVELPTDARYPQKHYVHSSYDANGNLDWTSLPVTAESPSGVTDEFKTSIEYFDTGWVASTNDHVNPEVHYDYTAQGWQESRIPENSFGTLDETRKMTWGYFDDGMLEIRNDRAGQPTTFSYDANNNLVGSRDASGLTDVAEDPDKLRRPVIVKAVYDSLDRVTKVLSRKEDPTPLDYTTTTYRYDLNGNVIETLMDGTESPSGSTLKEGRKKTMTYDETDWLATQVDLGRDPGCTDDERLTTSFYKMGLEKQRLLERRNASCASSPTWETKQTTNWTYFANRKLKTLTIKNATGAVVESHDVSYVDNGIYVNGNRTKDVFTRQAPAAATSPCRDTSCTTSYEYDPRERVVKEIKSYDGITSFGYDPQGNVNEETDGGVTTTFAYQGAQLQTSSVGGHVQSRYFYDTLGNLDCVTTAAGSRSMCSPSDEAAIPAELLADYRYDYLDRLEAYRAYEGGTKTDWATYSYDALDRVVTQEEKHPEDAQERKTSFAYQGLTSLVAEEKLKDAAGLSQTKTYSYDVYGQRISMTNQEGTSSKTFSYGYDVHGSTSLLLESNGDVRAAYGYTAYGDEDEKLSKGDEQDNNLLNPFRYTAKRFDTGSKSIDMGARRFGPDTMRFLQRDAFNEALSDLSLSFDPLTQNRYSLAGGNPVSFVEWDGHIVLADGGGTGKSARTTQPKKGPSGGSGNVRDGWQSWAKGGRSWRDSASKLPGILGIFDELGDVSSERIEALADNIEDFFESPRFEESRLYAWGDPLEDAFRKWSQHAVRAARAIPRPFGRVAAVGGGILDFANSEAQTAPGKAISAGASFLAFKGSPGLAAAELVSGGAISNSLDFVTINAEGIANPGLDKYEDWNNSNLSGRNGWLFRGVSDIGNEFAEATEPYLSLYEVDGATGDLRFQFNVADWWDGT